MLAPSALVLTLLTVPVAPQQPSDPPLSAQTHSIEVPAEKRPSLKTPTIVFGIAAAADWASTYHFLSDGHGREGNPILAPLQSKPKLLVATGIAMDVAGVWAWNRYVGRKHPRIAKWGLYIAAGVRTAVAIHNFKKDGRRSR